MRRGLIIVGAIVLLGALVVTAFAGGIFVGRLGARRPAAAIEAMTPEVPVEAEELSPTPTEPGADGEPAEATPAPPPTPTEVDDSQGRGETQALEDFDYDLLRTVLEIIDEQYYGEIPDGSELAYGAIRGMLTALGDPYTSFVEPDISAVINEDASGEFEGIGAMVQMREDGYLEIASLLPGQPAEAAGVRPGDIVVAVGDQSIVGLGLYEAISYIRGPAGTDAELEIIRPGESDPVFITVTRARIDNPIIESRMLDNDIAYLRLTEFDASAEARVESALRDLFEENPRALIFDLRNNPGGWLNQAIGVADLFLDRGLVATQRDAEGREQQFSSRSGDLAEDIPLIVLVNGGSASASEIVAGAIQDRGRGLLLGTTTLGKGSVQLPNDLADGSQLRVTIARWYTPGEQDLHGNGLTPNIEVDYPVDTPAGEDPQLDSAVEYVIENNYGTR